MTSSRPTKDLAGLEAEPGVFMLVIPEDLEGVRTDKAIVALAAAQAASLSRSRIQNLLENGFLSLSGKPVRDASRKVKAGESYALTVPPPEKAEPEAQEMDIDVVFEDSDVIVIDKKAGLVVHPAPGNRDKTLVNALLAHCEGSLSGIGGVARPGIVHRLDKDTSGLMVVAKNDAAHQALAAQFADRSLSRTYRAVVWGVPVPPAGSVDAPIGRSPKDRKKMAVTGKGKPALTHYRVLKDYGFASLVECKLATGRTHQIRVHMAHIKNPVIGDPAYGKGRAKGAKMDKDLAKALSEFPRQALHAVEIHFVHPRTGKTKTFSSKLPKDIQALVKKLEKAAKE
ncbi:MAG: RluA family pseudouridine synthase [Alphaproteobacteria bacterium]|nr:RluA family pseudouridine synthase [Alphaproteobacteria bacterium]